MHAQRAQIFTASTTAAWIEHFDLLISKYRCRLEPTMAERSQVKSSMGILMPSGLFDWKASPF
jgi:hypothetical protein